MNLFGMGRIDQQPINLARIPVTANDDKAMLKLMITTADIIEEELHGRRELKTEFKLRQRRSVGILSERQGVDGTTRVARLDVVTTRLYPKWTQILLAGKSFVVIILVC